jgi:hypothetical protein
MHSRAPGFLRALRARNLGPDLIPVENVTRGSRREVTRSRHTQTGEDGWLITTLPKDPILRVRWLQGTCRSVGRGLPIAAVVLTRSAILHAVPDDNATA